MKSILILLFVSAISLFGTNCTFQNSIFREINKNYIGKNLIISPLSIYQILGLTANGAQGETQKEMLTALNELDISELNEINYEIIEVIKEFKTVELANGIMTKFTPVKNFLEIAQQYLAPVETLESVEQVNNWCSEKTHGKIKKILNYLDPDVKMILLNAIYFKSEWTKKFISDFTEKLPFYNFNKEENENLVDIMTQTEYFNYYENSEIQAIKLNYRDDHMSAIIILPNKEIDINDYIESLDGDEGLEEIIQNFDSKKVQISFPRFKATFEQNLNEVLKNMGMKLAFTEDADFYALRDSDVPLMVAAVIHKTFMEVNEEGTEAAAVTIVEMADGCLPGGQEKIYEMNVNRPFLFLIHNNKLPKGYEFLFMAKIETIENEN